MILIVGATGTIGTQLVAQLSKEGQPVRVFTRDREKAAKFGKDVEIAVGNLDDEKSLIAAMRDVDRFFLITSSTQQDKNALAAANETGASHVVKISTQEAGWIPVEGHGHWHREREELIRASGLSWTFLRPSMYMNFALSWSRSIRSDGAIYCAGGDGKLGAVDPWDVAAVAKAALTFSGHENKAYELTGPELLDFSDMAIILSKVTGRTIRRVEISEASQGEAFAKMGLPKYTVDGLMETFSLIKAGRFAYLSQEVQEATGNRPRTFETWAQQHVASFR